MHLQDGAAYNANAMQWRLSVGVQSFYTKGKGSSVFTPRQGEALLLVRAFLESLSLACDLDFVHVLSKGDDGDRHLKLRSVPVGASPRAGRYPSKKLRQ